MRALILDGMFIHEKYNERLYDGKTVLETIFEQAKGEGFERFILLQNGNVKELPGGVKSVTLNDATNHSILSNMLKEIKNCSEVVVFDVGNPFYDRELIGEMLKRHARFLADYTYCLGYPEGLTPVVISKQCLAELVKLAEQNCEERRDYLFFTLSKDINGFDIETILSPYDLRIARLRVGGNDSGELSFTGKIREKLGAGAAYNEIARYCYENRGELYSTVYLLTLELTDRGSRPAIYEPPAEGEPSTLDVELLKRVVKEAAVENDNIKLILGGRGEPLEHPQIRQVLGFLNEEGLDVIIETDGHSINEELINFIGSLSEIEVTFVVKLDAYFEESYRKIRPAGELKKVTSALELLDSAEIPAYRQIVRMHINEEEIERVIREKKSDKVIIRKYSTYCGKLEERKVVDLSPLERVPCFQLRRELYLRADGKVSYCKQAFDKIVADAAQESLDSIIKSLKEAYRRNAEGDYFDFCLNCDDYYLFNF